MSLRSVIVGQFERPHGLLGRLAGLIMATRPSNRRRNQWTVELLALQPGHRILEIGCGPGFALKACAEKAPGAYVIGIDHSDVMVSQARQRLAGEIKTGRADVQVAGLFDGSLDAETYDRVYSLNVVQFFSDMEEGFRRIHKCLVSGGKVATTYQPRSKNPSRGNALEMAARIETTMKAVGYVDVKRFELPLQPVPAISVVGRKAEE
jgi:cyclopropane fatty-acyl-phospholipid synthase-like methyltransferase